MDTILGILFFVLMMWISVAVFAGLVLLYFVAAYYSILSYKYLRSTSAESKNEFISNMNHMIGIMKELVITICLWPIYVVIGKGKWSINH